MVMEFQGKKATHDFLSLYTRDSSMQLQDPMLPSSNYNLKTQDFLKPLEKAEETAVERGPAAVAHVLPGGIGTYSICHVAECDMSADVKQEIISCVSGSGMGSKMEPVSGVFGSGAFGLRDTPANSKEVGFGGQWPSSFAARSTASFTSRGFSEERKEDELFGKIECASRKELISARVDRKSGNDQKPTTPRSKHSATEQRRRSKINDRFQMLRDLIPHSDQKRDKASFLMEVIEYIRFLQEKVQKYEPSCPGWIEESNKSTPWNNSHVPIVATVDKSESKINHHPSGSIYSSENKTNLGADTINNPIALSKKATSAPNSLQVNRTSMERGTSVTQQRSISDVDNMALESQGQWLKPNDFSGSSNMLISEHDQDLVIDEGTISVSTAYSQNLLNTLNQALESSGIDMSQANLAVNINLGKRAAKRATTTILSSSKNFEDCEKALKRRRHSPDK